jgi:tetratricopeptide (TPR) repeat protein
VDVYRGLLDDGPEGTKPEYRGMLAYTCFLLGHALRDGGRTQEAVDAYRQSLSLRQKLAADSPTAANRWQVAECQGWLGEALGQTGQPEEAIKVCRASASALEQLVSESNLPEHNWQLAVRRGQLGNLFKEVGRLPEAESADRDAVAVWKKMVADFNRPEDRSGVAGAQVHLAEVLAQQGKHGEAVILLGELVQGAPKSAQYRFRLARSQGDLAWFLLGTKQYPDAERYSRLALDRYKELVAEDRAEPDYWYWMGRHNRDLALNIQAAGRPGEVKQTYEQAVQAYREAVPLYEKRAADLPTAANRWQLADCQSWLGDALWLADQPEEAIKVRRASAAVVEKLVTDFNLPDHRRLLAVRLDELGHRLKEIGRHQEAERAYSDAVAGWKKLVADHNRQEDRSSLARTQVHLVEMLAQRGKHDEAAEVAADLRVEGLAEPERSTALKVRGHLYAGLGAWDKADADLAKAIEIGSDDVPGVWHPLAVLHLRAHRTKEYRCLCEKLLASHGQKEDSWVVITCKLAPNAIADLSQPVHIAEKLVAKEPGNAEYLGLLGTTLYRKGDLEAAVKKLQASIRSGPDQVGVHWRKLVLAMAYHRLGRGEDAERLFQEATRWLEENVEGKVHERNGTGGPLPWALRLDLQLLHRETAELLKREPGRKKPN